MRKIEYKPLFKSKVKLVFNGKKKKINLIVDYNVCYMMNRKENNYEQ